MWGAGAAYQDGGCPEEVAEGIVEEVDEGGGVEVRVAHQLVGEEGLARAAAEEAAHLPVAHVHLVRDFLRARQDGQGTRCRGAGCGGTTGDGSLGVTWIRRLMELMSGRSLLPLSKCLQWEPSSERGLTAHPRVLHVSPPGPCTPWCPSHSPPRAHSLVQLCQEEVQAPQLLKQLCNSKGSSSAQAPAPARPPQGAGTRPALLGCPQLCFCH